MKILYIPFEVDDCFGDLEAKAARWQENYQKKGKDTLIVYHKGLTPAKKKLVEEKLKAGECKIYVVSHGMSGPEFEVANQDEVDDDLKTLSVQEIAQHFQQDLMLEGFSNNNTVKLYFCDVHAQDEKAKKMAMAFREQLGKDYSTMDVQYYTDVSICYPTSTPQEDKELSNRKLAFGAIEMKSPLFAFRLKYPIGRAKEYRHSLNEEQKQESSSRFFKSKPPPVDYSKFTNPLIKKFAENLVRFIQEDKLLSKKQEEIIKELFAILPDNINDYLGNKLTIKGTNLHLTLMINKPLFLEFLKAEGYSPAEAEQSTKTKPVEKVSVWLDPEDAVDKDQFSHSEPLDFESMDDVYELNSEETGLREGPDLNP